MKIYDASLAGTVTTVSGSTSNLTGSFTGSFSGSYVGDGSGLLNIPASGVTGLELNKIVDGGTNATISTTQGLRVNTDTTITGSLTVTGNLTAQQFIVSSSVTHLTTSFSSGSQKFGDSIDDTHQFTGSQFITGSVFITGSHTVNGSIVTTGASAGYSIFRRDTSVYAGGWYAPSSSILLDISGFGTALTITSSGSVGIGTTSVTADYDKSVLLYGGNPSYIVQTNDNTGYGYFHIKTPSYDWSFGYDGANNFKISNGTHPATSTKFTIASTGAATFSSSVSATSLRSSAVGTFGFNTANNGEFQIYATAADGLVMAGRGSTNDFVLVNKTGSNVFEVPTGTINTYFRGNVGINTASPDQKLVINQGATSTGQGIPATSGTTQNGILRLRPAVGLYGETLDFGMNVASTYGWIQATNSGNLATNYALALNPNGGNVGIGTSTPSGKLTVVGANANTYISIDNAASGENYFAANTFHAFQTAGTERVRITSTGVVQPGANGTQDLGTTSLRWATIYTSDLSLSNGIGDYTIVEGEEKLYLYNNKNNKVYSFVLQEEDPLTATPKKS